MNAQLPPGSHDGDDPRATRSWAPCPGPSTAAFVLGWSMSICPRGIVLEEVHQAIANVYFPIEGVASIVAVGENGESVDTSMIGREGMTGLAVFLGTGQMPVRTMVQVPMRGYRMTSVDLREELERGGMLVNLLQRYTQVVMVSMAQLILCNRSHRLGPTRRPMAPAGRRARRRGALRRHPGVPCRNDRDPASVHLARGQPVQGRRA